jgi:hypothetical protein
LTSTAAKYEAVIEEHRKFRALTAGYVDLLARTAKLLREARLALDRPVEIRALANELIGFVFEIKRDWKALDQARRASVGA